MDCDLIYGLSYKKFFILILQFELFLKNFNLKQKRAITILLQVRYKKKQN